MLLLVTGRPPRAESERPYARGAIRAAVGDWIAASRHAGGIAAVRAAHPRHGGAGAPYLILRPGGRPPPSHSSLVSPMTARPPPARSWRPTGTGDHPPAAPPSRTARARPARSRAPPAPPTHH